MRPSPRVDVAPKLRLVRPTTRTEIGGMRLGGGSTARYSTLLISNGR